MASSTLKVIVRFAAVVSAGGILLESQAASAAVIQRPSANCPGAIETVNVEDDTGTVINIAAVTIPSGATAICVTNPGVSVEFAGSGSTLINNVEGLQVVAVGAGDMNAIVNNGNIPSVIMEGNGATITNNMSGTSGGVGASEIGFAIIGDDGSIGNAGTVQSSGTESIGLGISGNMAKITNTGTAIALGTEATAVGVEGDNAEIINSGTVETIGNESAALFIEGNDGTITNSGRANGIGTAASAISIQGDTAVITNDGDVTATSAFSIGIGAIGNNATLTNNKNVTVSRGLAGMGVVGDDATLANTDTVTTTGENAFGMVALGGRGDMDRGARLTNDAGAAITTSGAGAHGIALGLENFAEVADGAELPPGAAAAAEGNAVNDGTIVTSGANADGMHAFANDSRLENRGTIMAGGAGGADANGMDAQGDDNTLINRGTINVTGANGSGISAKGEDLRIQNGDVTRLTSVPDSAEIDANASGAAGIRVTGRNVFVDNSSTLKAGGNGSTGIEVNVTDPGQLWIDNDAAISVSGQNGIGVHVRSTGAGAEVPMVASINPDALCAGGGSAGGRVLNCGSIDLGTTNIATAMLVEGIADTFIENQGEIKGTGQAQKGIVINPALDALPTDIQFNFVENFGTVDLNGQGATGVTINSNGDFFLNGTGDSAFSLSPGEEPSLIVSSFIDRSEARGDETGTNETQQLGAQGKIRVEGINARGLVINGDGNFIGNRLSEVSITDGDEESSEALLSEIVASGLGSIGVEFTGSANTLENQGFIQGDLFAIRGGDGQEKIVNRGTITGDVALGAGNDTMVLGVNATQNGTVDGGMGIDDLWVPFPADNDPDLDDETPVFIGTLNGDQYQRFENFVVDLNEPVSPGIRLQNTLAVDVATIQAGDLILDDAFLSAEQINIEAGGFLKGNGTISALPNDIGLVNLAGINVLDGGGVKGGESPGTLNFIGDVFFAGLLEIEIAGLGTGQFDVLNVDGDMRFEAADIDIIFLDDFLLSVGDIFPFLNVTGDITGFDTVSFNFIGAPGGLDFGIGLNPLSGGGFGLGLTAMAETAGVPEPETLVIFLIGLGGLAGMARRRRAVRR